MGDAEDMWRRRNLFEMPHAMMIGPPKAATEGFVSCARSDLFSASAQREVAVPRGNKYIGWGLDPTLEQAAFDDVDFEALRRGNLARETA